MKKLFQVEVDVRTAKEERLTDSELARYLRTADFISMATVITIRDITDDASEEEEMYKHLTKKIKEETDPDRCHSWCCALDRFCDTIRTRAGG